MRDLFRPFAPTTASIAENKSTSTWFDHDAILSAPATSLIQLKSYVIEHADPAYAALRAFITKSAQHTLLAIRARPPTSPIRPTLLTVRVPPGMTQPEFDKLHRLCHKYVNSGSNENQDDVRITMQAGGEGEERDTLAEEMVERFWWHERRLRRFTRLMVRQWIEMLDEENEEAWKAEWGEGDVYG